MNSALSSASMPFTLGYGTNGFADHPLPVALEIMAEEGYGAVALTLGHPHLDPFKAELDAELAHLRRRLETLGGMRVVIETGTRFLLDPRHKHRPTLVDEEADSRTAFLRRAVEIASALDAECVSFFAGSLPPAATREQGWSRLTERVAELVTFARAKGVLLAIEPEPGMLVETVSDALRLRSLLGDPDQLRVTVDIGHCAVVEPQGIRGALLQAGPLLANVQLDDMPAHMHEHRPFGQGDVDLGLTLETLKEIGYNGIAAVELPRHSYDAPNLARHSMSALTAAWNKLETRTHNRSWIEDSELKIRSDPRAIEALFPAVGRHVGRRPLRSRQDPSGILFGTEDDAARARLIISLSREISGRELAAALTLLYANGDSAERRGVLRGLNAVVTQESPLADEVVAGGLKVTAEALRANEQGLVAAAVGPFGGTYLDQHSWRHAILKLLFMGISLDAAANLHKRVDTELKRMLLDFADERAAAGRSIPDAVQRITGMPYQTSDVSKER
jgi:sugar phosphate isomerase/epimerase